MAHKIDAREGKNAFTATSSKSIPFAIKSILSIAWNSFTASDREAKPTRRGGAPSDPQPKPRPVADARPNVPAPMHSPRQSIASSRSSKRSSVPAQRFSSLPELAAALE
jgi:hypothetical protein